MLVAHLHAFGKRIWHCEFSLQTSSFVKFSTAQFRCKIASRNLSKLDVYTWVAHIDILYTLDSASLLVKLKPRLFRRLPPFE